MTKKVRIENADTKQNDENPADGWSASNGGLGLLIDGFDKAVKIDIKFGEKLTLDVINKKRDELTYAIKRLKLADNMLSKIHSEYTLQLERYSD